MAVPREIASFDSWVKRRIVLMMLCAECGSEATGAASGWMAFRGDAEQDDERVLVFYCSLCARLEFGEYLRERRARRQEEGGRG